MSRQTETVRVAIIMAGGAGERFWPLSRRNRPKQLLPLADSRKSLLAEAVERIAPVIPNERVFIVTGRHLVDAIRRAHLAIPSENILAEPYKRNTSGALAYATAVLAARFPDLPPEKLGMAIITADHFIGAPDRFAASVDMAMSAAEKTGALVACGVPPTRPETGFGYIQVSQAPHTVEGLPDDAPIYRMEAFHEKPDINQAGEYLASGHHLWNSGMFFWTAAAFLKELDLASPKLARAVRNMAGAFQKNDLSTVDRIFEQLDDISIDYALMEHAANVLVVQANFPWEDIGSWISLERTHGVDAQGNCLVGDPVVIDAERCIVYNAPGAVRMAVGVVGVCDLAVVVTEDGVLVAPKDRAQEVRGIVAVLKERGATQI